MTSRSTVLKKLRELKEKNSMKSKEAIMPKGTQLHQINFSKFKYCTFNNDEHSSEVFREVTSPLEISACIRARELVIFDRQIASVVQYIL